MVVYKEDIETTKQPPQSFRGSNVHRKKQTRCRKAIFSYKWDQVGSWLYYQSFLTRLIFLVKMVSRIKVEIINNSIFWIRVLLVLRAVVTLKWYQWWSVCLWCRLVCTVEVVVRSFEYIQAVWIEHLLRKFQDSTSPCPVAHCHYLLCLLPVLMYICHFQFFLAPGFPQIPLCRNISTWRSPISVFTMS